MKTFNYTLNTIEGNIIEGTLVSHQRELPKSAKLTNCFYSTEYVMHSIYKSFGKTTRVWIVKPKY